VAAVAEQLEIQVHLLLPIKLIQEMLDLVET
jgi:hypothetical protein